MAPSDTHILSVKLRLALLLDLTAPAPAPVVLAWAAEAGAVLGGVVYMARVAVAMFRAEANGRSPASTQLQSSVMARLLVCCRGKCRAVQLPSDDGGGGWAASEAALGSWQLWDWVVRQWWWWQCLRMGCVAMPGLAVLSSRYRLWLRLGRLPTDKAAIDDTECSEVDDWLPSSGNLSGDASKRLQSGLAF